MMDGFSFGHMGVTWFFWIFLIVIFGWILISNLNRIRDNRNLEDNKETPLEILRKRYAKGEISKEEFEQMKNTLVE